jgi:hypothetical protein
MVLLTYLLLVSALVTELVLDPVPPAATVTTLLVVGRHTGETRRVGLRGLSRRGEASGWRRERWAAGWCWHTRDGEASSWGRRSGAARKRGELWEVLTLVDVW